MSKMDITSQGDKSDQIIQVRGDLDARTAHEAGAQILALMLPGGRITLELTDVSYMSSAGIRALVMIHRRAESIGAVATVTGLSDNLRRTLCAVGFRGHVASGACDVGLIRRPSA